MKEGEETTAGGSWVLVVSAGAGRKGRGKDRVGTPGPRRPEKAQTSDRAEGDKTGTRPGQDLFRLRRPSMRAGPEFEAALAYRERSAQPVAAWHAPGAARDWLSPRLC